MTGIVNTDQAIFDAIVAATSVERLSWAIVIDTKAFIDTFNGHRDRKLCTSLDVAQAPEPVMTDTTNFRRERIEKLLLELRYEFERGIMEREIGEEMSFRFYVPISQNIPGGVVFCEFRTRPIPQYAMSPEDLQPRLKVVNAPPAATRDDDARARFLADRADTERKQASNPSSREKLCPSCNLPYSNGDTCPAFRGGCPMGGDF